VETPVLDLRYLAAVACTAAATAALCYVRDVNEDEKLIRDLQHTRGPGYEPDRTLAALVTKLRTK
jgi:hypothetical protein